MHVTSGFRQLVEKKQPSGLTPSAFTPTEEKTTHSLGLNRWKLVTTFLSVLILWFLWFIFTAKSVQIVIEPNISEMKISGGFSLPLGEIYLLREGRYRIETKAEGYYDSDFEHEIDDRRNQVLSHTMQKLPGRVSFTTQPPGVEVLLENKTLGVTPFQANVPAGDTVFVFKTPRYKKAILETTIEGKELNQEVRQTLIPNWADVTIPSNPNNAQVFVDQEDTGFKTPGPVEILDGRRNITVVAPGFQSWNDIIVVEAGNPITLPSIELKKVEGLVSISTTPSGASVTLDGVFLGSSPLNISVTPNEQHLLKVFKVGYAATERAVQVRSNEQRNIKIPLEILMGDIQIETKPSEVNITIDGKPYGESNQPITLSSIAHEVELTKKGYASFKRTITPQPGFPQQLRVRLLTLEEARLAQLKPIHTTTNGEQLVLLAPSSIRLGASRREPGRRANEVYRNATLERLFYLGKHEVTNREFKQFAPGHNSEEFQGYKLNTSSQPVTGISWDEAAQYCNWLSQQEGLAPFYLQEFGKITGVDNTSLGYRLPTEAEWAWTARHRTGKEELLRFPWGSKLPPENKHGNYADRAAQHLVGRIIFGYNDNHIVSAPVGTFDPNTKGIYDLGGNVAEWVHDFYEIPELDSKSLSLGPSTGEYRVIRGSSWKHGTVTELRYSFRDYGTEGRADVGFRIARYAE